MSAATAVVPGFPLVWRRFGDNSSQSIQHRGGRCSKQVIDALQGSLRARGPASHPGEAGSGTSDPEPQGGLSGLGWRLIRVQPHLHADYSARTTHIELLLVDLLSLPMTSAACPLVAGHRLGERASAPALPHSCLVIDDVIDEQGAEVWLQI